MWTKGHHIRSRTDFQSDRKLIIKPFYGEINKVENYKLPRVYIDF